MGPSLQYEPYVGLGTGLTAHFHNSPALDAFAALTSGSGFLQLPLSSAAEKLQPPHAPSASEKSRLSYDGGQAASQQRRALPAISKAVSATGVFGDVSVFENVIQQPSASPLEAELQQQQLQQQQEPTQIDRAQSLDPQREEALEEQPQGVSQIGSPGLDPAVRAAPQVDDSLEANRMEASSSLGHGVTAHTCALPSGAAAEQSEVLVDSQRLGEAVDNPLMGTSNRSDTLLQVLEDRLSAQPADVVPRYEALPALSTQPLQDSGPITEAANSAKSAAAFLDMQQAAVSALVTGTAHDSRAQDARQLLPTSKAGQKRKRQAAARAKKSQVKTPAKAGWEDWLQ